MVGGQGGCSSGVPLGALGRLAMGLGTAHSACHHHRAGETGDKRVEKNYYLLSSHHDRPIQSIPQECVAIGEFHRCPGPGPKGSCHAMQGMLRPLSRQTRLGWELLQMWWDGDADISC